MMTGSRPKARLAPTTDDDGGSWPTLPHGTVLTIVKLDPAADEVTRYPGRVLTAAAHWVAVEARWVSRRVELDGLVFTPDDRLVEYFSPHERFNVFAVFAPDGQLRGWYANVTHPPRLDLTAAPPVLTWQDLYVDLVALPDGSLTIRDEDELLASRLEREVPALHAAILVARDELTTRFQRRDYPFHDQDVSGGD